MMAVIAVSMLTKLAMAVIVVLIIIGAMVHKRGRR